DSVPAVPELRLESGPIALAPRTPSACLSDDAVFVGRTRVPFAAARAGERLSADLADALRGARAVHLWAPASRRANDVLLVARAFSRAGVRVTLVGRRGGVEGAIVRIEPARADTIVAGAEVVPDEVDLWVELAPGRGLIRATDGAYIPFEIAPAEPRATWDGLAERLREQRHVAPRRRRIVFAPQGALSYTDWVHALEVAAGEGYDRIELTPVGVLEALTAEVGAHLLARQGAVHPLPTRPPAPALIPREEVISPEHRSRVELDALDVGGYLDAAEVERVVRQRLDDFAICSRRAAALDDRTDVRVTLGVIIGAVGRAQRVGLRQPIDGTSVRVDDAMIACLRDSVARWVFAPSRSRQFAGIRLTLTFAASGRE
ncbi:MAG TPA: hypothetical protein VKY73_08420, partial [Polyangiaceae bacterium]|nr:hypothetical protein [Polyangiaceae bacterium]